MRSVVLVILVLLASGLAVSHAEVSSNPVPSTSDARFEAARFTVVASSESSEAADPVVPVDVMGTLEADVAVRRVSLTADSTGWDLKAEFVFEGLREFLDWYESPGGRETMSVVADASKAPLQIHLEVASGK
jgi:hypothetical protein